MGKLKVEVKARLRFMMGTSQPQPESMLSNIPSFHISVTRGGDYENDTQYYQG
jgi:hypothetical protein